MVLAPYGAYVLFLGLAVWLAILTVFLYKLHRHYSRLTGKTAGRNLKEILEELIHEEQLVRRDIEKVKDRLSRVDKESEVNIQKIGLIRFNPYGNTGGNQSFALALLNKQETGVILLSLHNREGTRIYIKDIKKGIASGQLSKEEKSALLEAKG